MTAYTRRRLLALGGAAAAGAVAGCSDAENAAESASNTEQPDGPVLETVSLENLTDQSQSLDLLVQWGNEIEYWETHELAAIGEGDSSLRLDSGWPTEAGDFQLSVRLNSDNETRAGFSSSQLPDRDCLDLVVSVSPEGELRILTDVSGGSCSADTEPSSETDA